MPTLKYCDICAKHTPHDKNGNCLSCWVVEIKRRLVKKNEEDDEKN
jgi:hypothetical protein